MERFVKGDVVVLPFPFSDMSNSKKRPALVLANLQGEDIILCMITSAVKIDNYSITLNDNDFEYGTLRKNSNIRPNRIFTADKSLILYKVGYLKNDKTDEVEKKLVNIFTS
ncbi:conserved hypothetical protein (plasmid) [Methanohalobium evestigatum Z-7303]|uniref:Transcriptional modulator of MazE/toxin, MazF n=1 Tax=Methanohalobium evestigatum (strain ATCC BAA-1072 / DSM 3721 / NBRC 107634 / OCM 161 / Z-7303) TaxID=644295 RepID=D7EBZ2_METEZ|nr:type II toxin-antitoxin system PemK/MazF family toxin [Methanohalobium evestigatum]ADI75114.1 conserved hypothetical protein [Methanohalobium evestigatum Z-7303]